MKAKFFKYLKVAVLGFAILEIFSCMFSDPLHSALRTQVFYYLFIPFSRMAADVVIACTLLFLLIKQWKPERVDLFYLIAASIYVALISPDIYLWIQTTKWMALYWFFVIVFMLPILIIIYDVTEKIKTKVR